MINGARLIAELQAAGLNPQGCCVEAAVRPTVGPATWYARIEGQVRVDWLTMPTPQQDSTAASVVAAHDGAPTESEKLDRANLQQRVLAALTIRASASFAGLSAARRNRIQALIDNAAVDLVALLS